MAEHTYYIDNNVLSIYQFKYEQEYINYLDTIKDGKIVNSKSIQFGARNIIGSNYCNSRPRWQYNVW